MMAWLRQGNPAITVMLNQVVKRKSKHFHKDLYTELVERPQQETLLFFQDGGDDPLGTHCRIIVVSLVLYRLLSPD